jgi:hypothetical protein
LSLNFRAKVAHVSRGWQGSQDSRRKPVSLAVKRNCFGSSLDVSQALAAHSDCYRFIDMDIIRPPAIIGRVPMAYVFSTLVARAT